MYVHINYICYMVETKQHENFGLGGGGVYERELVLDRQDGEKWNNALVFFLILIVFCIWCLLTC